MNFKLAVFAALLAIIIGVVNCSDVDLKEGIEDADGYLKAIVADVEKAKSFGADEKSLLKIFGAKEVCYEDQDLGCFRSDGPMKQTGTFPLNPKIMATTFNVYTASGKSFSADAANPKSFSGLDFSKRVVVLIHGFGMTSSGKELKSVKDHLLVKSHDEVGAVIIVGWGRGAMMPNYLLASANTELVGRQVGNLLNSMKVNFGLRPENVYLVGFSLGGQVSGFAGKWTQSRYGWKVGRITGLDSAGPLFEGYLGAHLAKADASFVDAIHTSAGDGIELLGGKFGFVAPYGSVDFYPNGGAAQTHCGTFSLITCNHFAAVDFYDASLHAKERCKFKGAVCDSWEDYASKKCPMYDSELGYFAEAIKKNVHARQTFGARFLATTKKEPFCG